MVAELPRRKLTTEKREAMRAELQSGSIRPAEAGRKYGVSDEYARQVKARTPVDRLAKAAQRWKDMQAMRDKGRRLWQIAEAFHVSVSTVAKCLLKLQSAKLDKKL